MLEGLDKAIAIPATAIPTLNRPRCCLMEKLVAKFLCFKMLSCNVAFHGRGSSHHDHYLLSGCDISLSKTIFIKIDTLKV